MNQLERRALSYANNKCPISDLFESNLPLPYVTAKASCMDFFNEYLGEDYEEELYENKIDANSPRDRQSENTHRNSM